MICIFIFDIFTLFLLVTFIIKPSFYTTMKVLNEKLNILYQFLKKGRVLLLILEIKKFINIFVYINLDVLNNRKGFLLKHILVQNLCRYIYIC